MFKVGIKFCVLINGNPESRFYKIKAIKGGLMAMDTYDAITQEKTIIGHYPQYKLIDFERLHRAAKIKLL